MAHQGNKLIDAATTLVGWVNYNATDPFERTLSARRWCG